MELEGAGGALVADLAQCLLELRGLVRGEQTRVLERASVRDGDLDVLRREADVEGEAPAHRRGLARRRRREASGPQRRVAPGHDSGPPCLADHTLSGSPHSLTNPSA